jgi:hypothetical protein
MNIGQRSEISRVSYSLQFAIIGGLLVTFGLASDPPIYRRSLDININLWWGVAMLVFGALILDVPGGDRSVPPDQGRTRSRRRWTNGGTASGTTTPVGP